jgi:peptidoglycan/xylan/chitin deacetylase (PgdA/CDA1 family)
MNRTIILMYHAVDEPYSEREARFCVRPREFARQMQTLRRSGYRPVGLDEIVDCLDKRRPMPENAVAVTFDDGFADVCENALPVLRSYEIPATVFIVTNLIDGSNEWMTGRGFPRRRIMSVPQLRELNAADVIIGSHTLTHPRMVELSLEQAAREATDSKLRLEDLLGKTVSYFAYPFGLYNDDVKEAVRIAGYRAACSTRAGFNRENEDPFALRRIDVFGSDALWQFKQKLRFGTNHATRAQPLRYYAGRVAARLGF